MCCPDCCTASAKAPAVTMVINDAVDPQAAVVDAIRKYVKRNGKD